MASKTLGAVALRRWLDENHMSQKDFSEATGISEPSICRYLAGDQTPGYQHRKAIRGQTGIELDSWDEPCAMPDEKDDRSAVTGQATAA